MKFSTVRLFIVSAVVMVFASSGNVGAETERSEWYISGGIGVNWTGDMKQVGWNRDTYCYPDSCDNPGAESGHQRRVHPGLPLELRP